LLLESPYLAVVDTIEAALVAKRERPSARFIAGGTEVIADQNLELFQPTGYVSLRRIESLHRIEALEGGLRIGAGVVIARLLDDPLTKAVPLLRRAARAFGTRQIRNRGTVGGNIVSGLADRTLPPCLLALNASVDLQSAKGSRTLALRDFLIGPGQTAIASDEILTGVAVPAAQGFQDYTIVGPRNAQFYVTASAALVVDEPSRSVRLGLGNAAPKVMRASRAEAFANEAINWDKRSVPRVAAAEFGKLAAADCDPPSDVTCGADYRRHAVKVMARRLLERAFEEEK
jgi:CO/xanthine dehydrogenase FAD-binding subunit